MIFLIATMVQSLIAHVAKVKLIALVQKHMNATLAIGSCSYWPPYHLNFRNVQLTPTFGDTSTPLLKIASLHIKLGSFPRDGRMEIDEIAAIHPILRLDATAQSNWVHQLFRAPQHQSGATEKPSQPFRLSRFLLADGEIDFKDQHLNQIDAKLEMDSKKPAAFQFLLSVNDSSELHAVSKGTIDFGQMLLSMDAGHVTYNAEPGGAASFLPAAWQRELSEDQARGKVDILAFGQVPLKQIKQSTFGAQVDLSGLRADNANWPAPLDDLGVKLLLSRADADKPASVQIADFHATSGPATLTLQRGTFSADTNRRSWAFTQVTGVIQSDGAAAKNTTRQSVLSRASDRYEILGRIDFTAAASGSWPAGGQAWPHGAYQVLAYPRESSFVIPHMSPIDHIHGGPILFTDHHSNVQNLSAHYGYDVLQIASARFNLTDPTQGLGVSAIDAELTFDRNSPVYPRQIEKILRQLHPQGSVHVQGRCVVLPKGYEPRADYDLTARSRNMSFALGDFLFPVDHTDFDAIAKSGSVTVEKITGNLPAGIFNASGKIELQGAPRADAKATFQNVDVRRTVEIMLSRGGNKNVTPNKRISGSASGDVHLENMGADWKATTGGGTIEITGGDFGAVPILSQLATAAHISNADFTGSEAAAAFNVSDLTVHLTNAAISAPAIGIQGDGNVKFNGDTHLHVVVAPLADWRQKLKSTGIPLLGDAAGALQTILNRATRFLFYEFHVTGNIRDPKVTAVPVPILTKTSGRLFAGMLRTERKENLLQMLHIGSTTKP